MSLLPKSFAILIIIISVTFSGSVVACCNSSQNIQLLKPVEISAELRAEFKAMPALRVVAVNAPPLAHYDEKQKTYNGIGIDVFRFIANELGLSFEIAPGRDRTVIDKILQVQEGRADVFIPLSYTEERAEHGLFTDPYYESYYAVITRNDQNLAVRSLEDLARYQVGFIEGVAFQSILESIVPATQLHPYNHTSSDGLFQAVRDGEIDIVVFNRQIFTEKRYHNEFLDLDVIHTLHEHRRDYGYYFSQTAEHERIVEAFNLYLAAIDISAAVNAHKRAERHFFERYMMQRDQRVVLLTVIAATLLFTSLAFLGLFRYRRMSQLLAKRTALLQQQQQELKAAYEKLKTVSLTDSLTGLANRRHFDTTLTYEYKRYQRTGQPLSLLLLDIDHFKCINDYYGHAAGDDYLRVVADTLKKSIVRSTDLMARYGGEEFTCLLTDATPEDALKVAERIHHEIAKLTLPNCSANPPYLTLSIGVATVISGDPGVKEIFAQADAQLYIAKNMGRNQIRSTIIEN